MIDLFPKDPLEKQIHQSVQSNKQAWSAEPKFLYRYEIHVEMSESGEVIARVYENAFPVLRETPACWVIDHWGKQHYVLKHAYKRFAYPNLKSAVNSLRLRTKWRKSHARWAMQKAELAEELLAEVFPIPAPAGVPMS